jgi:hypothetical protein
MDRARIFDLLDRYSEGSCTPEERRELEAALGDSEEAQSWFWEHAQMSALLREACQQEAGRDVVEIDALKVGLSSPATAAASRASKASASRRTGVGDSASRGGAYELSKLIAVAMAAMMFGSGLTFWMIPNKAQEDAAFADSSDAKKALPNPQSSPATTLINLTNCRWDAGKDPAEFHAGAQIFPGESLNLLEGIAEISTSLPSGSTGRFQLEGPLAMMLNREGMPNLQFGRLAAQISCDFDSFALETPMGRVTVPDDASVGLNVGINEVELHVFSGEATFEPLWPISVAREFEALTVDAGTSLRVFVGADGNLADERGSADENRFATRDSMAASRLNITNRYVEEIQKARPLAYWRFEDDEGSVIRNTMGDKLACRMYGEGVRLRPYPDNRTVEFGATSGYGYVMSDENLNAEIGDDYSVEAWIKPSHLHQGACFLLIDESPKTSPPPVRAGLSIQLRGPANRRQMAAPGRIRFTHRNPPADAGGTTCLSSAPYELRRWQHVVAVKKGSTMQLYLNGQVVSNGRNSTELAAGMRVLMGQLHPHDPMRPVVVRPFVGEMDEVAIYDRALGEREIVKHYELGRPDSEPPGNQSVPGA